MGMERCVIRAYQIRNINENRRSSSSSDRFMVRSSHNVGLTGALLSRGLETRGSNEEDAESPVHYSTHVRSLRERNENRVAEARSRESMTMTAPRDRGAGLGLQLRNTMRTKKLRSISSSGSRERLQRARSSFLTEEETWTSSDSGNFSSADNYPGSSPTNFGDLEDLVAGFRFVDAEDDVFYDRRVKRPMWKASIRPSSEKKLTLLQPRSSLQKRVSERLRGLRLRRQASVNVPRRIFVMTSSSSTSWSSRTAVKGNGLANCLSALPSLADLIRSNDVMQQLRGLVGLRTLLCTEFDPPISQVLQEKDMIVDLLGLIENISLQDPYQSLAFEACWIITNLSSGTHEETSEIVSAGAIPTLISLLKFPDEAVAFQAVWALGNISGDNASFRDLCFAHGIVEHYLDLLSPNLQISNLRTLVWAMTNLCRRQPLPPLTTTKPLIEPLLPVLMHDDPDVVMDACWVLAYITDIGNQDSANEVLGRPLLLETLMEIVNNCQDKPQLTPALRVIGNLVLGSDEQTQLVFDVGLLEVLPSLISHKTRAVRKEALWVLSNISAGSEAQVQVLLDSEVPAQAILQMGQYSMDLAVEVAYCISNMANAGTPEQIDQLLLVGSVSALADFLVTFDPNDLTSLSPWSFLNALLILLRSSFAEMPLVNPINGQHEDPPMYVLRRVDLLEVLLVWARGDIAGVSESSEELLQLAARTSPFWEALSLSEDEMSWCRPDEIQNSHDTDSISSSPSL